MPATYNQLLAFITILGLGFGATFWIGRLLSRPKKFSAVRYLFFLLGPIAATVYAIFELGHQAVLVFFISILIGVVMELVGGHTYFELIGDHLWKYEKNSLRGYSSLLVMPLWGCAGIIFFLVARLIS